MQAGESGWDPKEAAELGDEFLRYADTLKLEQETKRKLAEYVNGVQKTLSKTVELDPRHLTEWFPGADSAVLQEGEWLVLRRSKKETRVSILELESAPYMAVVQDVAAEVTRLMEEADSKRAKNVMPSLQVFVRSVAKYTPADWRSSELTFTNMGGKACHVMVFSPDSKEWYGPFDINAMETAEVGLRSFSRIKDPKVFRFTLRCEDEDGRRYGGGVELALGSRAVRVLKLAAADEGERVKILPSRRA